MLYIQRKALSTSFHSMSRNNYQTIALERLMNGRSMIIDQQKAINKLIVTTTQ